MHSVFLGSRLPLTKTFMVSNGVLTATPYPLVSRVTSYHEQFNSLQDLQALLIRHAAQGHCLFNGQLEHPLQNESRAGKTLRQPKQWVVFDFDKVDAKDHSEVITKYLPAECQQVSYIAQLSASMFKPGNKLWSGHIFMMLKEAASEQQLKQWFESLNFSLPELAKQVKLSDSLQALHWPLDRTAAYDSKIIYIAPPICYGFEPAVKEPITLVKKKLPSVTIAPFQPIDTVMVRQKINELRRAINEPEIEYATTMFEGEEVMLKAGEVDIQGIKASGDHYIRFNLNGGDSFAYFIDLRNPGLIRNFKGEPLLRTDEAAPELYKALRKVAPRAVAKAPLDEGTEVLAFYATNLGSQVKIGTYSPLTRDLTLNNASETAARAWLFEYGMVQKGYFPHLDVVFDPANDAQYIPGAPHINTFKASQYMVQKASAATPSTLSDLPPTLGRVIRSVLGTPDERVVHHFINWLAYVFQFRKKTGTAWVLNGTTGTGKGLFVSCVLRPLFGDKHVENKQFSEIVGEFNGFLDGSLFVVFEEADVKSVDNQSGIMAKLKHWITDSPLSIRKMRTDPFEAPNYSNFILCTNERTPVVVAGDDRRFNFGERQENKLNPTPNELQTLVKGTELEAFADVLLRWQVDEYAVTKPIETQARADAHEATTSINQLIADAVSKGDLQFFLDRAPSDAEAVADFHNRFNPSGLFKAKLDEYLAVAESGGYSVVTDEDLFVLFRTLVPDTRYFQDSKTWRKRHYKSLGLGVDKQHRLPGSWDKKVYGVKVNWQKPASLPDAPVKQDTTTTVVPIKQPRRKK